MLKLRTPNVAIARDNDQKKAAKTALDLIKNDINLSLFHWIKSGEKKQVLIKPNLLSTEANPQCNTSVETCLAVAEIIKELGDYKIYIGDGTTYETNHKPSTMKSLQNHGYDKYKDIWTLVDLHADETWRFFDIVNYEGQKPVELGFSRLADDCFVISVAKIKTHDVLGLTLSLKNMMGILNGARYVGEKNLITKGDVKGYMHGFGNHKPHDLTKAQNTGPSKVALAANLVRLAKARHPDLAVIDGSTIMEGMGPRRGNTCAELSGIAMASTDFIALDATCAAIAGLPLDSFQYVKLAGERGMGVADVAKINNHGIQWQTLKTNLKMHPLFAEASPWKQEELDALAKYTQF
nr:DUF362 domain-containing protein [Candidatus Sigynarchaeota archaeon]